VATDGAKAAIGAEVISGLVDGGEQACSFLPDLNALERARGMGAAFFVGRPDRRVQIVRFNMFSKRNASVIVQAIITKGRHRAFLSCPAFAMT
jgi:hypothetical protein